MRKLVFGCGYLGARVADYWAGHGSQVIAVTRDPIKALQIQSRRIETWIADVTAPDTLRNLPPADSVLFAVGYRRGGGYSIHDLYAGGLKNVLQHLPASVGRFIYISSTGVFGQTDDGWVNEESPCEPNREGGRACWEAESVLKAHPLGRRAVVLRMAGIYGPGRILRQRELQAGAPIQAASRGYLNLIHVDDAVAAVIAADQRAPLPSLYCVSDGHPVPRADYYRELAALLDAPEPRFQDPASDSPAALRAGASKRVSNERLLKELGLPLQYPSYREGLAAILQAECKGEGGRMKGEG